MHYLAIFLPNSTLTRMSYLSAKDKLVSWNPFSSRGLWKWYNSKVLDRRLYGVGQHFTCCRFSRKRKFFGNFNCDFRNFSPNGFSDCMNMKNFEIPVLTENSRYLQTAALKFLAKRLLLLSPRLNNYSTRSLTLIFHWFAKRRIWSAILPS